MVNRRTVFRIIVICIVLFLVAYESIPWPVAVDIPALVFNENGELITNTMVSIEGVIRHSVLAQHEMKFIGSFSADGVEFADSAEIPIKLFNNDTALVGGTFIKHKLTDEDGFLRVYSNKDFSLFALHFMCSELSCWVIAPAESFEQAEVILEEVNSSFAIVN